MKHYLISGAQWITPPCSLTLILFWALHLNVKFTLLLNVSCTIIGIISRRHQVYFVCSDQSKQIYLEMIFFSKVFYNNLKRDRRDLEKLCCDTNARFNMYCYQKNISLINNENLTDNNLKIKRKFIWTERVTSCLQKIYLTLQRAIEILVLKEIYFKKRILCVMVPLFAIQMLGNFSKIFA